MVSYNKTNTIQKSTTGIRFLRECFKMFHNVTYLFTIHLLVNMTIQHDQHTHVAIISVTFKYKPHNLVYGVFIQSLVIIDYNRNLTCLLNIFLELSLKFLMHLS